MNFYPEQLRRIAAMCEGLNAADGMDTEGEGATLAQRVKVIHPDDDTVLGYLVDEIGGAWSFEPVSGGPE